MKLNFGKEKKISRFYRIYDINFLSKNFTCTYLACYDVSS